jgi:hypothetical protein
VNAPPKSTPSALRNWGALLRLSLLPSALADVAAGLVLGGSDPFRWSALPAFLASLCIYHGGMALNDWHDRHADRALRPDRPLVSGAIAPRAALVVALLGLILGPLCAALVAPQAALIWCGVALCAAIYDLWAGARRSSPLWLGLCRAGNLWAAAVYGYASRVPAFENAILRTEPDWLGRLPAPRSGLAWDALISWEMPWPVSALLAAGGYGLYVAAVSFLAQLEDDPRSAPGSRPRWRLILAALLLLLLPMPVWFYSMQLQPGNSTISPAWHVHETLHLCSSALGLLLSAVAAGGLVRAAFARSSWTYGEVSADVGRCLRRLLIATASISLAFAGPMGLPVGLLILLGYPLARGLRRVFPPS